MACPAWRRPLLTRKQQMLVGLEEYYGQEPGTLTLLPFYNTVNPTGYSGETSARVESGGGTGQPVVKGGLYDTKFSIYVYGSGDNANPPAWTKLLSMAGWDIDSAEHLTNETRWVPGVGQSGSIKTFTDSLKHTSLGSRASISFTGDAGKPVLGEVNIQGLFSPRRYEIPYAYTESVVIPPVLKSANFSITLEHNEVRRPPMLGFGISLGSQVRIRYESSEDSLASEIFLSKPLDPTWSFLVEVEQDFDWVEVYRNSIPCRLTTTVGQEAQSRITFQTPTSDMTAYLATEPAYGDRQGIMVQELKFALTGDRFLEIIHR